MPYTITIPPEERDVSLRKKLQVELPGILNHLLEGARGWYGYGLGSAPAVEGYRRDNDTLHDFLEAHCDASDPCAKTVSKALLEAYACWRESKGKDSVSANAFGRMLTERGYPSSQARLDGKVTKVRQGLQLT